ncbi:hypothetical protein M5J15_02610 [Serratia symbiotica]|uniref:hypothetical protein n=1 Tax=Serratia symbiotica TaxID=138074 RepID=UPI001DDBE744|nr:hypothetical protein [Serratia symbiotica]NIG87901.1 hypothetical protein [Serratia symbiotica]USS96074.1 hypothetical protein M5J15_02610 [Serratia symbiotica]
MQSQGFRLTDNGWKSDLSRKVLLGNNIDTLNSKGIRRVQEMGRTLLSVGIPQFCSDDHTDNYGKDSYHDRLSLRRVAIIVTP